MCAVVPIHNEDPELAVRSIRSLLDQTRRLDEIRVVDDGSADANAADSIEALLRSQSEVKEWSVTRLPDNRGKRHALATGFRAALGPDVFLCIDSDTILDPNAVEHGIAPFADPQVTATAGQLTALNWNTNVLTRVVDLRYISTFRSEQASHARFGGVLCCRGALSFYRADVVHASIDDFLSQRFLGRAVTFGDDRRLTYYALKAGHVVPVGDSHAQTAVPERLGHYLRQQVRWYKSVVRESLSLLSHFSPRQPMFWLTLRETLASPLLCVLAILLLASGGHAATATMVIAAVMSVVSYARNAAWRDRLRPGRRRREATLLALVAPLYPLLHVALALPIRLMALVTLRNNGWGTRRNVEVRVPAAG